MRGGGGGGGGAGMRKLRFVSFSSDYPNLPLIHTKHMNSEAGN